MIDNFLGVPLSVNYIATQDPMPMTTTTHRQAETRFVALMTELFQMDEAQALDFGIYRVIPRHNQEVRAFLGEIVTDHEDARLEGGGSAPSSIPPSPPATGRPRPGTGIDFRRSLISLVSSRA